MPSSFEQLDLNKALVLAWEIMCEYAVMCTGEHHVLKSSSLKGKETTPDSPMSHSSKLSMDSPAQHSRTLIASGIAYCVCSASLILLNKYALSSFGFQCPTLLLVFHCSLAVLLVWITEALGYITVEPLKWEIVRMWAPVNLLFVAMLVTSFYALR